MSCEFETTDNLTFKCKKCGRLITLPRPSPVAPALIVCPLDDTGMVGAPKSMAPQPRKRPCGTCGGVNHAALRGVNKSK
jgi:hypothetical protein